MLQFATKHDDPHLKLGWGERISFGMASCRRAMLSGVLGSFIMIYMMNVALLDAGILSILFAVTGLMTVGLFAFNFCESNLVLIVVYNIFKGVGMGMASGMALGLVADSLTYGHLKTGISAVGMGNAGTSAAQKLGLGLGVAIFGRSLSKAGFDGTLAARGMDQPEAVLSTIRAFYNWIPMVLSIVLFVGFVTTFHLDRDLKGLRKEKDDQGMMDALRR